MGNLILCHDRHAAHPYEITRIHCRIFTIEELCYYLCNNLYLIDYTIMNGQLCDWLDEELEMKALASELRDVLRLHGSVEKFVLTILKSSRLYREPEMIRIQNVLEHLKNQKDIERQKFKGDNLLESGEVEEAILVYQAILNGEKDETVDEKFYGKIYASLGAAYGRLFLYQESAKMYDCDSVTSIGDCAFVFCVGLSSITLPDSVTSIGDSAFKNCSSLTSITIP